MAPNLVMCACFSAVSQAGWQWAEGLKGGVVCRTLFGKYCKANCLHNDTVIDMTEIGQIQRCQCVGNFVDIDTKAFLQAV